MRGLLLLLLSFFVVAITFAETQDSREYDKRESVGLVLSGGGAKGIAHVGVIKALEDNDIPIDYITGTSMGAIVGSLYSCGWTPDSMLRFFESPDFGYWSTGTINPADKYYFDMPEKTPQWAGINLSLRDSAVFSIKMLPANLISPIPMNIEFMRLYAKYSKQCDEDFNRLFVPFRCVCSDVYHKRKIVCSSGSLGDAVRASMSFPLVFKPIKLDGVLVYDGGIYDNFPVDVMRKDFKPDFIIGVSVSSPDSKPEAGDIYSQLEDMIIQNNDYSLPADEGVKIQVPVLDFGVLDFGKAQEIYSIGYKTGLSMVDSIKSRVSARRKPGEVNARREVFAADTPVVEFDSVEVSGASPSQSRYIKFLFDRGRNRPFGMQQAQDAYYQAVAGGKLSDLVPNAVFDGDSARLMLKATVKDSWNVGLGGWISSSTNSFLFLNFGYNTLRFNSFDANLNVWLGQTYFAGMLSAKFSLRSSVPSWLKLTAVVSRQKFYSTELLFYQNKTPSFISDYQAYVRMQYARSLGRTARLYADVGYAYLWDKYYPDGITDFADAQRAKSQYRVGAFRVGYELNTLDDATYPSSGSLWDAKAVGLLEHAKHVPAGGDASRIGYEDCPKARLQLEWKRFFPLHRRFTVGVAASGMATLEHRRQNYTAALISAPAFAPTPSTRNYFNPGFRSDNYLAAGVMPIWKPFRNMQLRGDFYVFAPVRNAVRLADGRLGYDGWFRSAEFIGEVAAVYNLPFASLSVYCNYLSSPARNWNFGINFGVYLQAPRFDR